MPFQAPTGGELPRTLRETYAEALKDAEREHRAAQAAMLAYEPGAQERYARPLYDYDRLQGMFPFVAAGAGDENV